MNERILGLDVLRAIAIMLVMYAHSMSVLQYAVPERYVSLLQFDGVGLFFVLSGFLIGRILLKMLTTDRFDLSALRSFWIRRWLRTLPAYFVVLTALIVLVFFTNSVMTDTSFYEYYIFTQNLYHVHPPFFPEAWSLSVEEWFYLLFPFILFIGCKFTKRRFTVFIGLVFAFLLYGMIYRYFICQHFISIDVNINQIYSDHIRKMVSTRLDSIMYGVLGAYIFFTRSSFWKKYKNISFTIGVFGILFLKVFPWADYALIKGIFYTSWLSFAVLCLLPKLNDWDMGRRQSWWKKAVVFISIVSYSVYLLNSSIINLLKRFIDYQAHPIIFCLTSWAVTFLASYMLYRTVEQPMIKWRDRRYKKVAVKNDK